MGSDFIGVFETADWILGILAVYLVVIVLLGIFYSRRIHESDDLVLAGRQLTLPFLVPSIVATWICAGAIMGAAGHGYLFGMQGVIFDPWAPFLCMILVGVFFAYRMRQAGYTTVVDFFNSRYSPRMGFLYLIMQVLSAVGWLGGQLVALGIIIHLSTGFPVELAIVIAAIAIIIVTTCGGLWALSRVDAIGFALVFAGLLIMFPSVMNSVGGWGEFVANASNWAELPPFAMTPVAADDGGYLWYTGIIGIVFYISAWAALGLGDVPSQVLMQRALAAKTGKTAVRAFVISGFFYLFLGLIPVLIGMAVFTGGLELSVEQAEYVLPWAADNLLTGPAATLFIVALAAAIISTSGDNALIVATLVGHNVYRYIKPQASKQEELRVVRIALPIVTLGAMSIALYFGTVYRLIVFTGAIQLATVFAPYVAGFFWKKANALGAVAAYVSGLISWVIFYFLTLPITKEANMDVLVEGEVYMDWAIWDAIYISMIPALVVSFAALIGVSLVTRHRDRPRPMVDAEGRTLDNSDKFFWSG